VLTVSEATRCAGVNAPSPSAALEVRQPDGSTAGLKVAASDGTARLVVDSVGRVGIGPTGTLAVPATVKNSASSGATLRVDGPVSGGYATSGVIEALSNGVLQGSFDGAAVADRYGLFNFFGSPSATRFGELNFLDRTASGDRRACTLFCDAVSAKKARVGLLMADGALWHCGFVVTPAGQLLAGPDVYGVYGTLDPVTSTCKLEAHQGFYHQGELGFFGVGPSGQQAVMTADLAFTCPAPTTPDYDFTATSGGYGFASEDEFNSCLAVLAAVQTRLNEVITALQAYGLLA
jgi:hypothetical protein